MSVDPESLTVGKCYITPDGQMRRIVEIIGDENVVYEVRSTSQPDEWHPGSSLSDRISRVSFADEVDREVDWPFARSSRRAAAYNGCRRNISADKIEGRFLLFVKPFRNYISTSIRNPDVSIRSERAR